MRPIDADAYTKRLSELAKNAENNAMPMTAAQFKWTADDMKGNAPTIGGWISADKRPPKQGRYLVWGLTQIVPDHTDEPNGYWQTKIAQWFERTGWDCKVKFWQMLPEPPKEDTP